MSRAARFQSRYGPWAVVTGASSGIGEAIARRVAADGLNVVLVARRTVELQRVAADIADSAGVATRIVTLDLASTNEAAQLDAATADLDVGLLVAAAGFGTSGSFLAADLDNELEMLRVNCSAVCAHAHSFGRRLTARGGGGIVLLASIVGFQGMPNAANYAATKAYVQVFGEALARELRPAGVDVLAAAPGPTASGFAARARMDMGAASRPDALAGPILASLGRRPTVLPDLRAKLLRASVLALPRQRRVQVMGTVMARMTDHHEAAAHHSSV